MARILCVLDGMSDPAFDARAYPALASFPEQSRIRTVPDGFAAETLPCMLSLLGISSPPRNIRGWIEALGAGIPVKADDLVFRGTWLALNGEGICTGFCDAPETVPELGGVRYTALSGYRSLFIVPGHASHAGSIQTVLPPAMLGKHINEYRPDLPFLRDALARINGANPGRAMLLWAPAAARAMPDFGQKSAVVCGANVVRGIAQALNMRLLTSAAMTGDVDTDLHAKLGAALELAQEYPFVLLHVGGCDEAAHRLRREEKEAFLRKTDEIVLSALLNSEHTVEVTSDHGSDPLTGLHIGDEQPFFRRLGRQPR